MFISSTSIGIKIICCCCQTEIQTIQTSTLQIFIIVIYSDIQPWAIKPISVKYFTYNNIILSVLLIQKCGEKIIKLNKIKIANCISAI